MRLSECITALRRTRELSVGNGIIDYEHRNLGMVNDVVRAIGTRDCGAPQDYRFCTMQGKGAERGRKLGRVAGPRFVWPYLTWRCLAVPPVFFGNVSSSTPFS